MMKQRLAFFAGGVLVGVFLLWFFTPAAPQGSSERDERLYRFVDQHVRAYGEARSVEDKVRQADDLYRKAVVLFLVDFGMKVQGLPAEAPSTEVVADDTGVAVVDEGDPGPSADAASSKSKVRSAEAVKKLPFAKRMDPRISRLNGSYSGSYTSKRSGEELKVKLMSKFSTVRGKLTGEYSVVFTGPQGRTVFRDTSKGDNRAIRLKPESRQKIWVAGPFDSFIQLQVGKNRLSGSAYNSTGEVIGKIQLQHD